MGRADDDVYRPPEDIPGGGLAFLERFDADPRIAVAADSDARITYLNREAERVLGPLETLLGQPLVSIIPERARRRHQRAFAHYLGTFRSHLVGRPVIAELLVPGDGTMPVILALTAYGIGMGRYVVVGLMEPLTEDTELPAGAIDLRS